MVSKNMKAGENDVDNIVLKATKTTLDLQWVSPEGALSATGYELLFDNGIGSEEVRRGHSRRGRRKRYTCNIYLFLY